MTMRRLDQITADIIPISTLARAHARRPRRSWATDQTTIVVMKIEQDRSDKAVKVSATGNPNQFAWLPRVMVDISRRDFGPFLLVTLTNQMANQKGLLFTEFDRSRFSESQLAQLDEALAIARRDRDALRFGGRTVGLHPNATA